MVNKRVWSNKLFKWKTNNIKRKWTNLSESIDSKEHKYKDYLKKSKYWEGKKERRSKE